MFLADSAWNGLFYSEPYNIFPEKGFSVCISYFFFFVGTENRKE